MPFAMKGIFLRQLMQPSGILKSKAGYSPLQSDIQAHFEPQLSFRAYLRMVLKAANNFQERCKATTGVQLKEGFAKRLFCRVCGVVIPTKQDSGVACGQNSKFVKTFSNIFLKDGN